MKQQRAYSGYLIKDGWKSVATISAVALLILLVSDSFIIKLLTLIVVGTIAYLYRNPERVLGVFDANAVLVPTDGEVRSIETIQDEFCVKGCYKIVIAKSMRDASPLRTPFNGSIARLKWQKGARLPLSFPASRLLNERALVVFDNGKSQCLVVHEPGSWCSKMNFFYSLGSTFQANWRYGYQIGGQVTLYLPQNSRVALSVGDSVVAGETLAGYFSSNPT